MAEIDRLEADKAAISETASGYLHRLEAYGVGVELALGHVRSAEVILNSGGAAGAATTELEAAREILEGLRG